MLFYFRYYGHKDNESFMVIIFVKHYLNAAGIDFFNKQWFPQVKAAISQREGFISISSNPDKNNLQCINITVKFETWEKLYAWAESKPHDELVDQLDPYRTRTWEVAKIEAEK